jgi:hypothetical protein
VRAWKSSSFAVLPFKNYLVAHGGGRAPGSPHFFEYRFAEANANYIRRLLGRDVTAEDMLEHASGGNA